MKKLVNGKVVDIKNIELFELAAEGLALQNTAVSNTSDGVDSNINSQLVRKYIKQYDMFFKSMPYPLYAIESNIKYATIGNYILQSAKDDLTMWVDNALFIRLDNLTGMTLRIVNNTWSIVYDTEERKNNTDLELYKGQVGYDEYKWVADKVKNKQFLNDFYKIFMPEFVEACNNQPMVLKWELENILSFGQIPNRVMLKPNKIINISDNEEYFMDIYFNGMVNTDEKIITLSLDGDKTDASTKYKQIRAYNFDLYSKPLSSSEACADKIEKCKINGIHNLFMQMCGIKEARELSEFPEYTGIISDTDFVFTIEKRLFISKSNRLNEPEEIACGVELYALDNNKVYFIKSKKINEKISKDKLFSYSLKDKKIRLCKIIFTY